MASHVYTIFRKFQKLVANSKTFEGAMLESTTARHIKKLVSISFISEHKSIFYCWILFEMLTLNS